VSGLEPIASLLSRRFFVEAAYYGAVSAIRNPSAMAHMFAGVACCGCAEPLAAAQRLIEGVAGDDEGGAGGLLVSPATDLPYEGFFHLIEAVRLDPELRAPAALRGVFDAVADDLAYASRREVHRPPDRMRRYSHRVACVSAALLIRRFTSNDRELPGVQSPTLQLTRDVIDAELQRTGGDATFLQDASEVEGMTGRGVVAES
jgi:hypothetical protein